MGAIIADRQARFLELTAAERGLATLSEILQRVSENETLAEVCAAWDVPFGRVRAWIAAAPAYFGALRLRADSLAGETVKIADGDGFPQNKRIRIDTRFRLAGFYDKQFYGDAPKIALSNNVVLKLAPEDERVL
jgi:hypothetical protein